MAVSSQLLLLVVSRLGTLGLLMVVVPVAVAVQSLVLVGAMADWVLRVLADWVLRVLADWVLRVLADWVLRVLADWVLRVLADWVLRVLADWVWMLAVVAALGRWCPAGVVGGGDRLVEGGWCCGGGNVGSLWLTCRSHP